MLNKEILLQWKSKQTKCGKKIDPYCCAIKAMVDVPPRVKTVGHAPTEKSIASYILRNTNRLQFLQEG